jgi:4-aminobutyrate aminotransferase
VAQDISLGHYTHEKSSVGCTAALATITFIENNGLLEHAKRMGAFLEQRLKGMKDRHGIIGDVRVKGMLAAIELVTDRITKEKAVEGTEKVMYQCMVNGLSFKVSNGNVITLVPPLITTQQELEKALTIIEEAIVNVFST